MGMRKNMINVVAGFCVAVACLGGCGGGASSSPVSPVSQSKATLKFSIANLPVGVKVGALQLHFSLPDGVVPAHLSGGNDASASLVLSGAAGGSSSSLSGVSFVSPVVTIGVANAGGLAGGEFLALDCVIASGSSVSPASFPSQATIDVGDDSGSPSLPIVGLTVPITVTLN